MNEQAILVFIASSQPAPTIDDIIRKLDFDNEVYPTLADYCVKNGICTLSEFKKAFARGKREAAIVAELGCVPTTPRDFIDAILDLCSFRLDPTAARPLEWVCPLRHKRGALEADVLLMRAEDKNRNLLGGYFKSRDITGQVETHLREIDETIREAICDRLQQPAIFDWQGLIDATFDTSSTPANVQIAVLQKWVWMVKRHLLGLPVTHHICPVIYGSQGCGKSQFVERLLSVLGSLATSSDFGRIADSREASLFKNYAIFLDEMSKADRAEMAAVKDVITRSKFSYRPMGTNNAIEAKQNASFIGTSNKLLEQLISDATGNRRFFQLDFNSKGSPARIQAQWDYVNALDFIALWQSVDARGADPTAGITEEIKVIQNAAVVVTTVQSFADHVVENEGYHLSQSSIGHPYMAVVPIAAIKRDDLFLAYRSFCQAMKIGRPYEGQQFTNELRRLQKEDSNFPFQPKRTAAFNGWEYYGPRAKNPPSSALTLDEIRNRSRIV